MAIGKANRRLLIKIWNVRDVTKTMLCLTCADLQQQEMGDRDTAWLTEGWVLQEEALKAKKNG